MRIEGRGRTWQNGGGESVQIGRINRNGQRCCGHRDVPGTDHQQLAYKVECTICGYVYGANGSDMHERLCPMCQGSAPGTKFWDAPAVVGMFYADIASRTQPAAPAP